MKKPFKNFKTELQLRKDKAKDPILPYSTRAEIDEKFNEL